MRRWASFVDLEFRFQLINDKLAAINEEALRLLRAYAGPLHLLVSDIVIPKIGGRELARLVAAIRPGVKVLYLSGYTDDAVLRLGIVDAEVNVLQKPFSPATSALLFAGCGTAPEPARRTFLLHWEVPMKIGFVSLGCPKNLVDSEVMLGMAEKDGHEITADASQADVLVVNTCAFIDRAKQESIDTILEMAEIKKQAAGRKLVVTGCMAERYREELKKEIPEIDAIYGTGEVEGLSQFMGGVSGRDPGAAKDIPFYTKPPLFGVDLPTYIYDADTPRKRVTPAHYAYVKIAEGCDYKCAFCIIPKMRGRYRSRSVESIAQEARQLAAQGVKELLLISQDSTFYGIDRGERGALPKLLRALNEVAGIEWIRLLYLYPTTITSDVIDAIADLDKVVKYIDLPLQHASDAVLKRMKRPGTRQSYVRLLENIRARIPAVALRTTFIVGFPGETAEDFASLEGFIEEIGFDHVGVFTYSHEEGTSAHDLTDDVPPAIKKKRQDRLMARQRGIVTARQQRRMGERTRLVVDGQSPEHELVLQGRLQGQAPEIDPVVYLTECDPSLIARGSFIDVEIVGSQDYDLIARPVERA